MIIVESPSKCKQISLYSGLQCLPSIGHVRCLESVDDGEPTYKLLHEKHVQKMKKEKRHYFRNGQRPRRRGNRMALVCRAKLTPHHQTHRL